MLKIQIQCNAQEMIKSVLSKITILPDPKPTLQAINKPCMISLQIISN